MTKDWQLVKNRFASHWETSVNNVRKFRIQPLLLAWMPLLHLIAALTSAVVAGIVGSYLHDLHYLETFAPRFIYIELVAGLSILVSLFSLITAPRMRSIWFLDAFFSLSWFVAFGFLMEYYPRIPSCGLKSPESPWSREGDIGLCNQWRVTEVFSFVSGAMLFLSSLMSIWQFSQEEIILVEKPNETGERGACNA